MSRRSRGRGYWEWSKGPLHSLVLVSPWLALVVTLQVAAMAGLDWPGTPQGGESLVAPSVIGRIVEPLGRVSGFVPALLVVAILLWQHVASKRRWRVRPGVLAGMAGESVVLTLPLLVLAVILGDWMGGAALQVASGRADSSLGGFRVAAEAGLYEELLFRLIGMGLCTLVLQHAVGLARPRAIGVAIVVTAVAFAISHDPGAGSGRVARTGFYVAAGLYFGLIYAKRGFGIAAVTHVAYDAIVLLVLSRPLE